ncbi:ATP-binding protein [Streptomyces sp. NPDC006463]|uniref:ATP-binding protein n=1 Tax=Streptomyces sp. NPDC006463 TaxID=3364746 RepID=UPI0036B79447
MSARAADVVMLVVSELVTNARTYAPGPYRLTLEVQDGCVEVSVWDSNPTPPSSCRPTRYPFRTAVTLRGARERS